MTGERVLMVPLDGKLPNLALMRLAAWERSQGATVTWKHDLPRRELFTPQFDRVFGSAIFGTSTKAVAALIEAYPHAVIGGSGGNAALRVEDIVPSQFTSLDYSGYPSFDASIGYAMRGCRFKCGFCVVPKQEGKARSAASIDNIWRGPGFPRHLHLLDNDFFGNPEWRDRVDEIVKGKFKVCINQGVNVRLLTDEQAEAVFAMHPWDDGFTRGRLYCAWDNIGDERVFFEGIDRLERAGWMARWVMAYMLVGYDPRETWERLMHRYDRMRERGVMPFPMVHDRFRDEKPEHWRKLKQFQRWAVSPAQGACTFEEYRASFKRAA